MMEAKMNNGMKKQLARKHGKGKEQKRKNIRKQSREAKWKISEETSSTSCIVWKRMIEHC